MSGSNYIHFGAVKIRVNGTGNLKSRLIGFDNVFTTELSPIALQSLNANLFRILSNFTSQASRLKVYTTAIDEQFVVNDLTIFVNPIWSEIPG